MRDSDALTIAFIERRPVAAGRALAAMDAGDAAALLETIPTRFVAEALANMSAWSASLILVEMEAVNGAAALREPKYQDAAAMLRLMPPQRRAAALDAVPTDLRADFETSLSFPRDTIGAHMDIAILVLPTDHTVADAVEQVRRAAPTDQQCVFVVNDDKTLVGLVLMSSLLRHPPDTALADIVIEEIPGLSARARIAGVDDDQAWDTYSHLPVTSRRDHVIGALSRRALREAMRRETGTQAALELKPLGALAAALAASVTGLAGLLAAPTAGTDRG